MVLVLLAIFLQHNSLFLSELVGLCQQIAQACDLKTAVRLARTEGVNLNLFLQPPPFLTTAPPEVLDGYNLYYFNTCEDRNLLSYPVSGGWSEQATFCESSKWEAQMCQPLPGCSPAFGWQGKRWGTSSVRNHVSEWKLTGSFCHRNMSSAGT